MFGRPAVCPGEVGRPTQMSECGRKTLPDVREALSDVQKWLGDPPDVQEWWEPLLDVREACQMLGSGRKAIPNVREWS